MIKAAIIGMGNWGHNLVSHVQGKSEQIQFIAGATRTPEKAQAFADEFQLKLFDSYEALLASDEVDAVVLATPHTLHSEQIIAAAKAGKHVFSEKPIGLDLVSARAAAQACKDHDVVLSVGYNWRFQPALREIHRLIENGSLGRILHMEGNFCGPSAYRFSKDHWRHEKEEGPAGGMTGRGVHVLDAMIYLSGKVEQVTAQSYRLAQDFGIDDTTSMLMRFENWATAYLGTVIATAETWRLQVFCANGWVEVGDIEHLHTWGLKVCMIDREKLTSKPRPVECTFDNMSTELAELEYFAQCIQAGQKLVLPDSDPIHNVAVLEAINASSVNHLPVRISQ